MTALHDPATPPSASIVDLIEVRQARGTGATPEARSASDPVQAPHGENILAFPIVPQRRTAPRSVRRKARKPEVFDPREACEQLVQQFRVMHEAMVELVVACRNAPPDARGAALGAGDDASEVMLNLATLSMSTERFQEQLGETVAAAFR